MAERIAVLGAGTMGAGIAQAAAAGGFEVLLYDISEELVQRGLAKMRDGLQSRVDRGKMSREEMEILLGRITTTTSESDAAQSNFIIEAIPEELQLKRDIFARLGRMSNKDCVLATNTSSLSITSIASAVDRPERVIGLHFFNPAPMMPLVEVIAGSRTSQDVIETTFNIARAMGKIPVVAADTPGFIVNRVARPFYGEALKMVAEGSYGVAQIDEAMRGAGFRMGPFELMDLIGIDINFAVTKSVYEAYFGESRYRPNLIQQRMVEAGTLGRKTSRGFYSYENGEKGEPAYAIFVNLPDKRGSFLPHNIVDDFLRRAEISLPAESEGQREAVARILSMVMNEAAFALGEGVTSVRDIDRAMVLGTNYPKGPLKWADQIGLELLLELLTTMQTAFGEERYRPAPLLLRCVATGATGDAVGDGFHSPGEKGMV